MVTTQHGTDGCCGLAIRTVLCQMILIHRINNAALTGLHTVAYIGKRTRNNHRHGIFDKRFSDLFFDTDIDDFLIFKYNTVDFSVILLTHFFAFRPVPFAGKGIDIEIVM